jgi:hypothetical protein
MNASHCLGRVSVALALTILPRVGLTQDSVPADIATFARDHGDAGVLPHVVGHLDSPPFTLFSAGSKVGVRTGDRIGWLRQPADLWGTNRVADTLIGPAWFDLHSGDSAIAATAVDPRLAAVPDVQLRVWRAIVAQSAVTTLPTLLALVRTDQTLGPAVATSPRLLDVTSPVTSLTLLANANDQVAAIVVQNPVMARNPRALVTIAEAHPAVWADVMRRALDHVNDLVASGPMDERTAVHLVVASWTVGADSIHATVAALPAVQRSGIAHTILMLAADTDGSQPPPPVSEDALRVLMGRMEADTNFEPWFPPMLGNVLMRSRLVRANHTFLWDMTMLPEYGRLGHERWRDLRLDALMAIARDTHAPPEELERVARALADSSYWQRRPAPGWIARTSVSPDSARVRARMPSFFPVHTRMAFVAQALMTNPRARDDRDVLQILATLPSSEFGSVPLMAQRQLQMLSRRQ